MMDSMHHGPMKLLVCVSIVLLGCGTNVHVSQSSAPEPLAISTSGLPAASVGTVYSAPIHVTGGTTPYTFSGSSLPVSLSIDRSTGVISGSPLQNEVGTTAVMVAVSDSGKPPQSASRTFNLVVSAAGLSIATTWLPGGTVGGSYQAAIEASGGTSPYTFAASGLPTSLAINSATGAISGTPVQSDIASHAIAVTVHDSSQPSQSASITLMLTISAAISPSACSAMSTGDNASLNGFVPFPASSAWNTDISTAPLDPNNAAITSSVDFAGFHLHHDFSSVAGGNYGIPYVVVDSGTVPPANVSVFDWPDQSDVAAAPLPVNAPIEGSPADCAGWPSTYIGDGHLVVLDRRTCMLYETYNTHRCKGSWSASSETIWDMQIEERRPWGWTSADAAGLAVFPGLVRYDEVASGAIHHALRFTMQQTKNNSDGGYFVEPASHAAGNTWSAVNVMGMRIRLKAGFDISGFSASNRVILTAMKKYGMILADNGGYFYFQGAPDSRWNDDDLNELDSIDSANFEVVQTTPAYPGYDAATAPTGAPPTISSFTASPESITAGTPVTLAWTTSGDSYEFIDQLGGVHGRSTTVAPNASTTYTLNATNRFGRTTATVTVTVH